MVSSSLETFWTESPKISQLNKGSVGYIG